VELSLVWLPEPDPDPDPEPDAEPDPSVLALRSDGLVTPLVSVNRRLFSMRANRAFTSSNSDVVTR